MFWCWRKGWSVSPSVTWGLGPGLSVAPRSSSWGAQSNVSCFHLYVWTQHTRIVSFGTDSVLSWAHPIKPSAPFQYYVTMLSNGSSLDQKDTCRSSFLLCDLNNDSTPKRENLMSLFTEEKQK